MAHDIVSEGVGLVAAALTSTSFVAQVYRIWRTRDASSISTIMYVMFTTGAATWLVYGLMIDSPSVVAANTVSFCLSATVLVLKWKHTKVDSREPLRGCSAAGHQIHDAEQAWTDM
jgi:MtN3 and saliva related transmembrane protein